MASKITKRGIRGTILVHTMCKILTLYFLDVAPYLVLLVFIAFIMQE